jgi:hypothetical protein
MAQTVGIKDDYSIINASMELGKSREDAINSYGEYQLMVINYGIRGQLAVYDMPTNKFGVFKPIQRQIEIQLQPQMSFMAGKQIFYAESDKLYRLLQNGKTYFYDLPTNIGQEYVIGNNAMNEIPIPFSEDSAISKKHVAIRKTKSFYSIRDMDSTNGTWLRIDYGKPLGDSFTDESPAIYRFGYSYYCKITHSNKSI